jgi:polysaccharide biosynthesis transport protein
MQPNESELNLLDYLVILRKRQVMIIVITLAVVTAMSMYLYLQVARYAAQVKVLFEYTSPVDSIWDQQYFYTQKIIPEIEKEMILNSQILGRVIKQLKLSNAQPGTPSWLSLVEKLKRYIVIKFQESDDPNVFYGNRMMATFVSVTPSPDLAMNLLNSLVEQYQLEQQEYKLEKDLKTKSWLDTQLVEAKTRIEDAEKRFQQFKQDKGILSLQELQDAQVKNFSILETDYNTAVRNKKNLDMQVQNLVDALKGDSESSNLIFSNENPSIAKNVADLNDLKIELSNAQKTFKEKHPAILEITAKISLAEQRIRKAKEDYIKSKRLDLETAQSFELIKFNDMNSYKQKALEVSNDALQYSLFEREVETSRQLYELLGKQLKETAVRTSVNSVGLRVLEPPLKPLKPISKSYPSKLFLAAIVGFLFSVGVSVLLEFADITLKTPEDVKRYLNIPVVGMIPRMESDDISKKLEELSRIMVLQNE